MRCDLQAHHKTHTVMVLLSYKTTAWLRAMVAAWKTPLPVDHYLFRASYIQGVMNTKIVMVCVLLSYHGMSNWKQWAKRGGSGGFFGTWG